MSRDGFPIDDTLTQTVHNSYTVAQSGDTFNGTDELNFSKSFQDKVGFNTPGWPQVIQDNDYFRSAFKWRASPLSVHGTVSTFYGEDTWQGQWGNTFGLGYYPWSDSIWNLNDATNEVNGRLINKLISQIQSNRVNLGEVLATMGQTADLVASTAKRLVGSLRALKRGNVRGAINQLTGSNSNQGRGRRSGVVTELVGGIPEQWLQLKYGWEPLLSDVHNSLELLQKTVNSSGARWFSVKATAKATGDPISYQIDRSYPHGPDFIYESTSRTVSGKAQIVYGMPDSFAASMSQFGITNPLSVAWELVPWSFVADWMYPIGPFLESLDYSRGLVMRHGYISFKASQAARSRVKEPVVISGNITGTWSGGGGSGDAFLFQRHALGGFPGPVAPIPKNPVSLTHVANALSLLQQVFSGKGGNASRY